jgi:hypothetical protein
LAEALDIFRLRAIATGAGGRMSPSGNLSFTKITLVGWMMLESGYTGTDEEQAQLKVVLLKCWRRLLGVCLLYHSATIKTQTTKWS